MIMDSAVSTIVPLGITYMFLKSFDKRLTKPDTRKSSKRGGTDVKAYSSLSDSGKYYRNSKKKRSGGRSRKKKMSELTPSGRAYRRAHS